MTSQEQRERIQAIKEDFADQHGPLLSALRGLEVMLETSPPAPGDLERRLNQVADTLSAHIMEEETGDFVRWVPDEFPAVKPDLDSLVLEHAGLIQAFRELAIDTRGAKSVGLDSALSIKIRKTIAAVREHEAREAAALRALDLS